MPKLLSCKEVAEITGTSYDTVMGWCRSGKLPASKLGGKNYRISEDDLLEFINSTKKTHEQNAKKYNYKKGN